MGLIVQDIHKTYGDTRVLRGLSLFAQTGSFMSVVGRSGCGKTTLLRILGGFEKADAGYVELDERRITAPGPDRMMIFQDYNQLFPWKTLRQNIIYAMRKTACDIGSKQTEELVLRYIAQMGLTGFENNYPHQLSGGMKQRGALARALALKPSVLLMDEPFSSLDSFTRKGAQQILKKLWQDTGLTVLLVTHDIDEALFLSQEIAILGKKSGQIKLVFQNDGLTDLKSKLEACLDED